ncbi:bifunctional diguanylate cyclase/phosphodiesterase [Lysobacter olei]
MPSAHAVPLPPIADLGISRTSELLEVRSVGEGIAVAQRLARATPGVADARVLLPPSGNGIAGLRDDDVTECVARQAWHERRPARSPDGEWLGLPLPHSGTVLLLRLEDPDRYQAVIAALGALPGAIDHCLRGLLRVTELENSVVRLEHSEQLQRALFAISDLAGSGHEMPELLRGIHAIVGTLMYAENLFIVLYDEGSDTAQLLYFVDLKDIAPVERFALDELEHSLTWYVIRKGMALRGDSDQLDRLIDGPVRRVGSESVDWLGVPLLGDGQVRGALVVQSYEPGVSYTAEDQALLEFVGSHVLTALDRRRSTEALEHNVRLRTAELAEANRGLQQEIVERQRAERLQAALFQIADLANADLDERSFYYRIHEVVWQLIEARNFYIALLDDERRTLQFAYFADELDVVPEPRIPGQGLAEYVMRQGRPQLLATSDLFDLHRTKQLDLSLIGPVPVSWLGVPLRFGDEIGGVVAVRSYEGTAGYGTADQELLEFVASQIASVLNRRRATRIREQAYAQLEDRVLERTRELRREIGERERIQRQLEHEVQHDALTGLPNRGVLQHRLELALEDMQEREGPRCALLYLDVDRFKVINDSLGHSVGDEFLREVSRRMVRCVREPDVVARLAGDEFAILLVDIATVDVAVRVAKRLLDLLSEPLQVGGKTLSPSASIGIAVAGDDYRSASELLRDADLALYRAKALGRKQYALFDDSFKQRTTDVLTVEAELHEALHNDHFEPFFQPIVRLSTGEVVGNEALLRWRHPTRGVLTPDTFLSVAEDSGAIDAIDWRMFELSCRLAAQQPGNTYLTINVSPRHFRDADFDRRLLDIVARTGLPPARLLAEVTEGSLLDNSDHVRDILARLQAAGVRTALDDFGTGYSALSYLHTFPLRVLKIDRSFVADLGQPGKENIASVIAAVLALAGALGMDVIAEGIETEAQRQALLALGCEFGQGYLLGRPAAVTVVQASASSPAPVLSATT